MVDPTHKVAETTEQTLKEGQASNFAAIILAAGLSTRMGDVNKLLLEFDGQTLLRRSVMAVKAAGIGEILIVLGHDCDHTMMQLTDLNVRHVVNSEYQAGQMGSVHCGLSSLSGEKKAVFICLADQPMINATHLQSLMFEFDRMPENKQIVVPVFQNQRGNPVILSETVRRQVLQDGGNPGCRRFIDGHPELVNWVTADDVAFINDIDTQEEYASLLTQQLAEQETRSRMDKH